MALILEGVCLKTVYHGQSQATTGKLLDTKGYGWCYFRPPYGQKQCYFPSTATVDGKEDSHSAIFHPHGPRMSYSHSTYHPGGWTDAENALCYVIFTAVFQNL